VVEGLVGGRTGEGPVTVFDKVRQKRMRVVVVVEEDEEGKGVSS